MSLSPYTIRYKDRDSITQDFCCYASDAFDARLMAIEAIQDIHDCPNRIVHIFKEDQPFDW